jgi:hypothetical protein
MEMFMFLIILGFVGIMMYVPIFFAKYLCGQPYYENALPTPEFHIDKNGNEHITMSDKLYDFDKDGVPIEKKQTNNN